MGHHPDFILRCNHGKRGDYGDFVQRFRWMKDQGHWVATRTSSSNFSLLQGDSHYEPWQDDKPASPEHIRTHNEIRCATANCPNRVPADMDGIEDVFAICDPLGYEVRTIAALAMVKGVTDTFAATFVAHRTDDEVTLTLDSLRKALSYRNKLCDTLNVRERGRK